MKILPYYYANQVANIVDLCCSTQWVLKRHQNELGGFLVGVQFGSTLASSIGIIKPASIQGAIIKINTMRSHHFLKVAIDQRIGAARAYTFKNNSLRILEKFVTDHRVLFRTGCAIYQSLPA